MKRFLSWLWRMLKKPFGWLKSSPAVMSSQEPAVETVVEPVVPEPIAQAFRDVNARLRSDARAIVKSMGTFSKAKYHQLVNDTYEQLKADMFANVLSEPALP